MSGGGSTEGTDGAQGNGAVTGRGGNLRELAALFTKLGFIAFGGPAAHIAILNPVIPKLRESRWTAAFLDAVNAAAVGLMAAVTISLARGVLVAPLPWAIAVAAAALHLRLGVGAAWLVLGGALAGALVELGF